MTIQFLADTHFKLNTFTRVKLFVKIIWNTCNFWRKITMAEDYVPWPREEVAKISSAFIALNTVAPIRGYLCPIENDVIAVLVAGFCSICLIGYYRMENKEIQQFHKPLRFEIG
ncbi:hypothetical protein Fcan01_10581 [Folsomia candida]|uniref:Uncharacterized protein n=1 Tax=Folsomia candida TaxID=158441 RepID=A0A226E736_FOLCA|nr:hypothetical protein Fcan01_10581 [Folsomia candida]